MDDIGGWSRDELARLARFVVADEGAPEFYAVTGSRIYGFADDASDVDIRGFHVADSVRYLLLDQPVEQVRVTPETAASTSPSADVDLVSYELRKFTTLLSQANFNVLELVFDGLVVTDDHPADLDALRSLVESFLPLDVPAHYMGMARHQYERSVAASTAAERPTAKEYLYGVRGMLAAHFVGAEQTIESDVRVLSEAVLGETTVVDSLVEAKRRGANPDTEVAVAAEELMHGLLETAPTGGDTDEVAYREALDRWMLDVRGVDWNTS